MEITRTNIAVIVLVAGIGAAPAFADVIVDTGPANFAFGGLLVTNSPGQVSSLAGEFSIGQSYSINSVEGWTAVFIPGDLKVSIYGDGGEVPDVGNLLFSTITPLATPGPSDWRGVFGLDWDLPAGTYWVAFEAPSGSSLLAAMPGDSVTLPLNPLVNEANLFQGNWQPNDDINLGWRILGTPSGVVSPVPEPITLFLFSAGLAAALVSKKVSRRRAQARSDRSATA